MDEKSLKKNIKKSFFSGNAKTIISMICTALFLPLIIKKIGIENYGILALSSVFIGMFGSFELGIAKTVTILLSASDNNSKHGIIFTNALSIIIVILSIIGLIFILISNIQSLFGDQHLLNEGLKTQILFISYFSIVLALLNNLLIASLQGYLLNHYADFGQIIFQLSYYLLLFIAAFNFDSIFYIILTPLIAYFIQCSFLGTILLWKTNLKLNRINFSEMKEMISLSFGFFCINATSMFAQPINKYLLFYFTGNTALLGMLDLALKLGQMCLSLLNASTQPLLAIFSNLSKKQSRVIKKISFQVSILIAFQYTIGMITFYFIGYRIVNYLLPGNADVLYNIALIFIGCIASSAIVEPFFKYFLSNKMLKLAFIGKLIFPLSNFIILYFIFNQYDMIYSITISYSAGILFSNIAIFLIYFSKSKELQWN